MGGFFYGKYSKEQVERANQVDLEELLTRQGEALLRSGREKRLAGDHSVTIHGNEWFDHASGEGGHALSFVRRHYGLSFGGAMQLLTGEDGTAPLPMAAPRKQVPVKPFVLPPANSDLRRVFGYLLGTRKLDREVLSAFVREKLIYEDAPYHNAVFIGTDEHGVPRHAHKRSTNSEGKTFRINVEGSDPAHSFHWTGSGGKLFVFEAPIDLLSYISLHPEGWRVQNYVSLCGVSEHALVKRLELQPEISEVYLCLDNDKAGHAACERLSTRLAELGNRRVESLIPEHKDWNDDLKVAAEEEQIEPQKGGMTLAL